MAYVILFKAHVDTFTVATTPLLRDLQNHISPHYAACWRKIGAQLGLPGGKLDSMHTV